MKKTLLLLLCLTAYVAQAQTDTTTSQWKLQWHGFVNPVVYADTRQVVAGREGMMLFYPKPVKLDSLGNDTNAQPSLNMLSITARLNLTIQGPDVLGAKMKGFIEGDFSGGTDATINMFRLRHAYLDMRWQHNELLLGQYWYPMVVEEIMPGTQPLNMGAPFHPYARYNQIRDYVRLGKFELMAVASFQLDNKSQGPEGPSTVYLKRSMLPELNLQARYVGDRLFAGVAVNYLRIEPYVDHPLSNHTLSLFARYRGDSWSLKGQALLNSNLYEACGMGGYFIKPAIIPPFIKGYNNITPNIYNTFWIDMGRTKGKWRPGFFAGYATNLNKDICWNIIDMQHHTSLGEYFKYYGRGLDIHYLWRVQPRLAYYAGNGLNFAVEVEHTVAQYLCESFKPEPESRTANTRFILSACYAF